MQGDSVQTVTQVQAARFGVIIEPNTESGPMNPTNAPTPEPSGNKAAENIAEARQLLQALQEQLGKHPALEEALEKLELALSALTLQTGGLL